MADRAELVREVAEQLLRLKKVESGTSEPLPSDSDIGVLSLEQNQARSLVRALEEAGYAFTLRGEMVGVARDGQGPQEIDLSSRT